jgi:glycosyltransferase involved in cell wall biosynthesis
VRDAVFSVVVPAYNAARTLPATIRSVLAQTFTEFELIVVDDGSTEPVEPLVASVCGGDPRVRVIRQQNAGPAAARDTGIHNARADLVSVLDSDDLYMPEYVSSVRTALQRSPEAGIAFTDCWILNDESKRIHRETGLSTYGVDATELSGEEFLPALLELNFITASTVTVRKQALEEAGGFATELQASEDYELWLRIAAAGFGAVRPPGRLVVLRNRPGSMSKNRLLMARSLRDVLSRASTDPNLPDAVREMVEARVRRQEVAIRAFAGEHDRAALGFRLRHRLALLKTRLATPLEWRRRPPQEVLAAFRDLETL